MKCLIQELIQKGHIWPSFSPYVSPIILVQNKDGAWRICIQYRVLNKITIKNKYPIRQINDHLDHHKGTIYFSKIDLYSWYYKLHDILQKTNAKYKQCHDQHWVPHKF